MSTTPGDPAPAVPTPAPSGRRSYVLPAVSRSGWADRSFKLVCQSASWLVIVLAILLVAILVWQAWLSIWTNGIGFFTTKKWDPEPTHREFGALAFVYGTVVTSVIAMLFAVPLGTGTAAFLAEVAPHWLRKIGAFFVEMLAAIPSVVYGFWGLAVFAPAVQQLISSLGGPGQASIGLLPAGLVLAIMIVPYIAAVSFDVIRSVPRSQREASLSLGATRWQTIWRVVIPYARPGIIGGSFLALGRALGETMAVTMLIGNRPDIPDFQGTFFQVMQQIIFGKGNSIPSVIANEFTEATYDLYLSALVELGLVLLLVSVGFSALGRVLIWQMNRPGGGRFQLAFLQRGLRFWKTGAKPAEAATDHEAEALPTSGPIRIPPVSPRSERINRLMIGGEPETVQRGLGAVTLLAVLFTAVAFFVDAPAIRLWLQLGIAVMAAITIVATLGVLGLFQMIATVPLFLIVGYLLYRGATSLSWDFFVNLPAPVGEKGGGMANAFYTGSFLMIGLATAFSVPIGLLTAIYLAEYRSRRLGSVVRFIAEMIGSVPSIVIGIFGYYTVVKPITQHFSGLAGGFALGIMMLPIVIRASEEMLKLVPGTLRQASYALGASQWQTVVRVSVPAALPAIITAIFLSIARVAGETAPLLLTASNNRYWPRSLNDYTPSLPVFIYSYATSGDEDWLRQAWAAAFVLVSAIMILNVGIRIISGKRVLMASQAD